MRKIQPGAVQMVRVSVLMPVRNEEASVAGAVRSVLGQTERDLEVLVVDGDSQDGTVEQVRAVAATDPRVRLCHNPRRTIPTALNIGLEHARGEYVARVDAHATVNPEYLARGMAVLDGSPDVAAVGGKRMGTATTPTGRAIAAALSSPFGVGNSINHYAEEEQDSDHASFGVFRTEVLRAVGGWDETLSVNEDVDIDHRILALGHRIRFHPGMEIHWHVRESLRDFGRQYRRYGRGKAAMVRKNGAAAVRPRHLAAPALVATLAAALAAAATGRRRAATALTFPYALGVAAAAWRTRGPRTSAARLAGAFVTMHLAWGAGFLEGLLGRPPAAASGRDPSAGQRSRRRRWTTPAP